MIRYVAFLRGVSPMNAKMPELKGCFEWAGFSSVKTVISSGNVVFDARSASAPEIELHLETAMTERLGRTFYTIVRPVDALAEMLQADPYLAFEVPVGAKRVVTFLRNPVPVPVTLPIEAEDARILAVAGGEAFSVYVPGPRPSFMRLIEKTFGTQVTTRTWETVKKCVSA